MQKIAGPSKLRQHVSRSDLPKACSDGLVDASLLAPETRFDTSPLYVPIRDLGYDGLSSWAWENYRSTVTAFADAIVRERGAPARLLEVGAGRDPLFATAAEARASSLEVTLNDIDSEELARAPDDFAKLRFDIASAIAANESPRDYFDLVISKMVLEHITNAERAWSNVFEMLRRDGMAAAFIPTLFSPPFLLNRILPEQITSRLVQLAFGDRSAPKFPARYEWCYADQRRIEPLLKRVGFRDVLVLPFWTHGYFKGFPLLRGVDTWLQRYARDRDWRGLASYAYVIARK
jgi:SAM-dependent methyltransferase